MGGMEGKWYRPEKYQVWIPHLQLMCQVAMLDLIRNQIGVASLVPGTYDWYSPSEVKLRKWTYLTDRNGKDLYTGDVCRLYDWPDTVQIMWCNNGFYEVLVHSEDLSPSLIPHKNGTCRSLEIIGNVYANPELSEVYDANGAGGFL